MLLDYHPPMTYRSRRERQPKLAADGKPSSLFFTKNDREICALLAPTSTRFPWGYYYLPTTYIFTLIDRQPFVVRRRLRDLFDHGFLERQGIRTLYRDEIYSLNAKGEEKLRSPDNRMPFYRPRRLTHELLACIIGASFEYGARAYNLSILPGENNSPSRPDWPVFTIGRHTYFIEADMDTESLHSNTKTDANTIEKKLLQYLHSIDSRTIKNARVLFVTISYTRQLALINELKRTIDKSKLPHKLAEHFCFTYIDYDRDLFTIPKLTEWALTTRYERAGHDPFTVMESEVIQRGKQTSADQGTHRPAAGHRS